MKKAVRMLAGMAGPTVNWTKGQVVVMGDEAATRLVDNGLAEFCEMPSRKQRKEADDANPLARGRRRKR